MIFDFSSKARLFPSQSFLPHETQQTCGSVSQVSVLPGGRREHSGLTVRTDHVHGNLAINWVNWINWYRPVAICPVWLVFCGLLIHFRAKF